MFPLSPMACFTPHQQTLGIVHGDLWCVCWPGAAAWPGKPMHEAPGNQCLCSCCQRVWNLMVSIATEHRQHLHATCFRTQWLSVLVLAKLLKVFLQLCLHIDGMSWYLLKLYQCLHILHQTLREPKN